VPAFSISTMTLFKSMAPRVPKESWQIALLLGKTRILCKLDTHMCMHIHNLSVTLVLTAKYTAESQCAVGLRFIQGSDLCSCIATCLAKRSCRRIIMPTMQSCCPQLALNRQHVLLGHYAENTVKHTQLALRS